MEAQFWTCDECHRVYSKTVEKVVVTVERQTETVYPMYGSAERIRPVEQVTICKPCMVRWIDR